MMKFLISGAALTGSSCWKNSPPRPKKAVEGYLGSKASAWNIKLMG
ncbi:hypothetical protein AB6F55_20845 [Providencia hangzhouensis]